ncbi:hypothetical protein [Pseudobacillus badius]|uniref:hypothetical protein n=1 Tax=Bacillus badius TaxID=1455 RepID=UPI000B1DC9A2|nr:hypothetical protein [Bacillus badius]
MSILLESQIKSLRTEGLILLVEDAERRIGSHIAAVIQLKIICSINVTYWI